jgi:hypothetical protein
MAYESIQAPKPISFQPPRMKKRDEEEKRGGFEFAHWLADEAAANEQFYNDIRFPVPLMSAEGVLILAQAQEEEFSAHMPQVEPGPLPEKIYQHAAEAAPVDEDQLSFEFITDAHGAVVDDEI